MQRSNRFPLVLLVCVGLTLSLTSGEQLSASVVRPSLSDSSGGVSADVNGRSAFNFYTLFVFSTLTLTTTSTAFLSATSTITCTSYSLTCCPTTGCVSTPGRRRRRHNFFDREEALEEIKHEEMLRKHGSIDPSAAVPVEITAATPIESDVLREPRQMLANYWGGYLADPFFGGYAMAPPYALAPSYPLIDSVRGRNAAHDEYAEGEASQRKQPQGRFLVSITYVTSTFYASTVTSGASTTTTSTLSTCIGYLPTTSACASG